MVTSPLSPRYPRFLTFYSVARPLSCFVRAHELDDESFGSAGKQAWSDATVVSSGPHHDVSRIFRGLASVELYCVLGHNRLVVRDCDFCSYNTSMYSVCCSPIRGESQAYCGYMFRSVTRRCQISMSSRLHPPASHLQIQSC